STILPGDYNYDQVVDELDYLVWKAHYGSTTQLDADGNGDGKVDSRDFLVWRNNLGATTLPPAAVEVALEEVEAAIPVPVEAATTLDVSHGVSTIANSAPLESPLSGWSLEVLAIADAQEGRVSERRISEIQAARATTVAPSETPQERQYAASRRAAFDADSSRELDEEIKSDSDDGAPLELAFAQFYLGGLDG